MRRRQVRNLPALTVLAIALPAPAQEPSLEPWEFIYRTVGTDTLSAHVFLPREHGAGASADAILLFHGGGWHAGAPEWTFGAARRFAERGLAAIAVEYRLSGGEWTPIDAAEDACAAFAWTRAHAPELGLSGRLAGYGVSAGGQLVALAATRGCPEGEPGPQALVLWSPALDLTRDRWFERQLQGRAPVREQSPLKHVSARTPPTTIVVGGEDTLTPAAGAERFCTRVKEAGGVCEIHVYESLGHLLTRNLTNQESDFDPDPEARADGVERQMEFLERMGFFPGSSAVAAARRFREHLDAGEFEAARGMQSEDPRRWFETREGSGSPWRIGPEAKGPWADWDVEFGSRSEPLWWAGRPGEAVLRSRETSDYFRLLERDAVINESVYLVDAAGRIEGLVIRALGERPPGRTEEFLAWARIHAGAELESLMPDGEIDPGGDRPRRYRALLERWRQDAGLPAVPRTVGSP